MLDYGAGTRFFFLSCLVSAAVDGPALSHHVYLQELRELPNVDLLLGIGAAPAGHPRGQPGPARETAKLVAPARQGPEEGLLVVGDPDMRWVGGSARLQPGLVQRLDPAVR